MLKCIGFNMVQNTKFYHLCASQRRMRNKILQDVDEHGVIHTNTIEIGSAFTKFYQSLFTSSHPSHIDACLNALTPKVST